MKRRKKNARTLAHTASKEIVENVPTPVVELVVEEVEPEVEEEARPVEQPKRAKLKKKNSRYGK